MDQASSDYIVHLLLRRCEINFFRHKNVCVIVVFSDKLYLDKDNINFYFIEMCYFLKGCIEIRGNVSLYIIFIMKCFIFFVKYSIFYQCDD